MEKFGERFRAGDLKRKTIGPILTQPGKVVPKLETPADHFVIQQQPDIRFSQRIRRDQTMQGR